MNNMQHVISSAGLFWSVTTVEVESDKVRGRMLRKLRVRIFHPKDLSLCDVQQDYSQIVAQKSIEGLLVRLVCDMRDSGGPQIASVWKSYRDRSGCEPVTVDLEALNNLGELLHVALRKYVFSAASSLVWSAINEMQPKHWALVIEASKSALTNAMHKHGARVTRYTLGNALRSAWMETADKIGADLGRKSIDTPRRRSQLLVAIAFEKGVAMLENEDWVWGMTSTFVTDGSTVIGAAQEP